MNGTIAIDARMLGASGIGTYIENLLGEFKKLDHSLYFKLIGDAEKLNRLVGSSSRYEIIPADFPIYSIAEQFKLPKLADGCDILHSPHHNVPILYKGKLLVTFQDALHWDHPEYIPNWRGKIYLKFISKKIRRADWIITSSQFTANRACEIFDFPSDKITVTPYGVNTHHFSRRSPESVRAILEKYGIHWGNYLFYIGNIKPHKNIENLIKAYELARAKGVRANLVLAGKISGLRAKVDIEKFSSAPGVKYVGEIPYSELPYFYSGARALVFVSLYEGFGLPPLEAMACGCPVLCSNTTSLPEVVGDSAILVNPENVEEIAKKIKIISLDLKIRKKIVAKSKERIKLFKWEKTAEKTLEIYKKLLEE
ncbi:glycosyltransferase family 4 protein [bacterium]|nr:glycosyltransferase family 4 protein [bacterium]